MPSRAPLYRTPRWFLAAALLGLLPGISCVATTRESPQATRPAKGTQASGAEARLPAPDAGLGAPGSTPAKPVAPLRVVHMEIPEGTWFASAEGRKVLKYLVSCALDETVEAHLSVAGEEVTYPGIAGLAPEWADRPLTLTEQRWVSACLYARVNRFGIRVMISQRGTHPKIGPETDTEEQLRDYPLHEGGYFGNVFLPAPLAYVCEGADSKRMLEFPVGKLRRCVQPSGKTPDGRAVSECGFIITGPCTSPASLSADGARYDEVVHTWLSYVPHE